MRREFGKVALVDMLNLGTTKAAVPGGRDPERQNKRTEKMWLGVLVNFEKTRVCQMPFYHSNYCHSAWTGHLQAAALPPTPSPFFGEPFVAVEPLLF